MTIAEFKALKVGDKVLVKGTDVSFVTEDKIKTVTKIEKDRIQLTDDRGFYGFVGKREMTRPALDWYQVVKEGNIPENYKYHHTASKRGYVSRKNPEGIVEEYSGRFGEGFTVLRPRFDTTQYCYIDYYIKEAE